MEGFLGATSKVYHVGTHFSLVFITEDCTFCSAHSQTNARYIQLYSLFAFAARKSQGQKMRH